MNTEILLQRPHTRYSKLRKMVKELDTNLKDDDDALKVAVILLYGARYGQEMDKMYKDLPFGNEFINSVALRFKENKIWVKGKTHANWFDEKTGSIAFWIDVNVGLGFVERAK